MEGGGWRESVREVIEMFLMEFSSLESRLEVKEGGGSV